MKIWKCFLESGKLVKLFGMRKVCALLNDLVSELLQYLVLIIVILYLCQFLMTEEAASMNYSNSSLEITGYVAGLKVLEGLLMILLIVLPVG